MTLQQTIGTAVSQFVSDTDKVDIFVNGTIVDEYTSDDGGKVPSIRKYLHELFGSASESASSAPLSAIRPFYSPNKRLDVIYGVLRQNPTDMTRWEFLDDAAHTPEGFDTAFPLLSPTGTVLSPYAAGASLRVNFKKYTDSARIGGSASYDRVGVGLVCADEVLSQQYGIKLGAKVLRNAMVINGSMSKTCKMRIYHNSSAWVVTQDNTQPFTGVTTSYDSATGLLTVNHGWQKGDDVQVLANTRSGLITSILNPLYNSATDTSFTVRFQNPDGTLYTGAAGTKMSFNVTKTYNGAIFFDGTSGFDAIQWKTTDAGNIWVFAVMQRAGS